MIMSKKKEGWIMKKKQHIGTIQGIDLMKHSKGKLSRNDGIVKSGTGYHKSEKQYNRKSKSSQCLKNKLKNYRSLGADFLLL